MKPIPHSETSCAGPVGDSALSLADRERFAQQGLVGRSAALNVVLERALDIARYPTPVLITGPTGSGKTALARAIHAESDVRGDFVPVNAASLQPSIGRSELFGIEGERATGVARHAGLLATAHHGTLFLDEVGTLGLDLQATLLKAVDEGSFTMVGSTKLRTVEVRWIFATNVDLNAASDNGTFRGDLLSRIEGWTIELPSLNERLEDIPDLVDALVPRMARTLKCPALRLTPAALDYLHHVDWSRGNIRQLENVLRQGLIRANNRNRIRIDVAELTTDRGFQVFRNFNLAKAQWKRHWLTHQLRRVGGDVKRLAKDIGISISHAYKLIQDLDISK
ncbi:MAG: sigma 54-interacting transcriptional regulator [Myxococcota bacterium]